VAEIVEVMLPDGQIIHARLPGTDEVRDIGFDKARALVLDGLQNTVRAIVDNLHPVLERHAPDEVGVEFGLELAARSGKVVSVLAEASATSSIKIQLTWRANHPAEATDPAAGHDSQPAAAAQTPAGRPQSG